MTHRSLRTACVVTLSLFVADVTIALAQRPIALGNAYRPNPTLQISPSGKRFLVNGAEEFLIFFSYFDALDREADWSNVLNSAWNAGFSGVRIFPNWWDDYASTCMSDSDPLMNPNGGLNAAKLDQLKRFLDAASNIGFIVDVSFAMEPSNKYMSVSTYLAGIVEVVSLLGSPAVSSHGYRNVVIDVQNEWTVGKMSPPHPDYYEGAEHPCKPLALTAEQLQAGLVALRAADQLPSRFPGFRRLFTASTAGTGPILKAYPEASTEWYIVRASTTAQFDFIADHNPRDYSASPACWNPPTYAWWCIAFNRVDNLIAFSSPDWWNRRVPIVYQEPAPDLEGGTASRLFPHPLSDIIFRPPYGTSWDVNSLAASLLKEHGGAGYTFHTEYGPLFGWGTRQGQRTAAGFGGWTPAEAAFFQNAVTVLRATPWGNQ